MKSIKIPSLLKRKKFLAATARRASAASAGMEFDGIPEPNMKLSRALLIVLLLHVVAVSGIIAFNAIKTRERSFVRPASAETENKPAQTAATANQTVNEKPRTATAEIENARHTDLKPSHPPPVKEEPGMSEDQSAVATEASRPGLSAGPTSEFSLFFHVKPGEGESIRAALRDLQETPGYRPGDYGMAIASIHEARFVLFDDDTRLAFVTSFDGSWDAYMDDFLTSGPTLALFDAIFSHTEGYDGLPDLAALQAFVLGAQQTAAAYARNYGGTVKEIRKGLRVNDAFQRVLDDPEAAEALQHPALKPLLDEAAD